MIGRREFGIGGMSLAALGAMHAVGSAEDKHAHSGKHEVYDDCAEACSDCQRECDACSDHCARMLADGMKEHLTTLRSCRDCADVCATAAEIVARRGYFAVGICKSCADVCDLCAKECEKFPDDKMMKECADECRECAKACRDMVQALK